MFLALYFNVIVAKADFFKYKGKFTI
jgi:hypothetical protein